MKRYIYLAVALLAASACTREPFATEDTKPFEKGPIKVTLVSANPETRTGVGDFNGVLKPFWSEGDGISVHPTTDTPDYHYYQNPVYFSGTIQEGGLRATFEGNVESAGSYFACYPPRRNYVGPEYASVSMDGTTYGLVRFVIPSEQYPSLTSFDPDADFLVSEPFQIGAVDEEADENISTNEIPVSFTRMNAIVKIVLQDEARQFENQKVRRVTLSVADPNAYNNNPEMPTSATRAEVWDNNGQSYHGLSGRVNYVYPMPNAQDAYHVNWGDSYPSVSAIYPDETYRIGEDGAATYLITVPSILKNQTVGRYDYESDEYITYNDGLYLHVETDNYIIERNIKLPNEGLALQPSRVTTLNINLNAANTVVREKTIEFESSDYYVFTTESNEDMAFTWPVLISKDNVQFSYADFAGAVWTLSNADFVNLYCSEDDYLWVDDCGRYAEIGVEGIIVGETTLTVNYLGMTASCTIHVVDWDSDLVKPIVFEDDNVKSICYDFIYDCFDGYLLFENEITPLEASYFTSIEGIFVGNSNITSFNELQYFTGLETLENAFSYCGNLESVRLPANFKGDISWAFYGCENLVSVGDLPEGMTEIGYCAFSGCGKLSDITLPSTIETIAGSAFYGCELLPSISLPETLRGIGDSAFRECKLLQSVSIPGGVGSISSKAFMNCTSLESVTLSEGLVGINENAFYNCGMHEIEFPSTLEWVNTNSFALVPFRSGHDGYNGITFRGTTPPIIYTQDYNYKTFTGQHWNPELNEGAGDWTYGIQINVPAASLEAYSALSAIQNGGQNIIVGF